MMDDEKRQQQREARQRWGAEHREERNAYMREWNAKNKERVAEKRRALRLANHEAEKAKARARQAEMTAEQKAKQRAYYKEWRARNAATVKTKKRAYYEENRARAVATMKAWREKNRDSIRLKHVKRYFDLSPDEYNRLLLVQGERCAICREPETMLDPRTGAPRRLAVDHDHDTAVVRGLLCYRCNYGVGYFQNDPARLRAAADYLEAHSRVGGDSPLAAAIGTGVF